jgi:hypothetical protein
MDKKILLLMLVLLAAGVSAQPFLTQAGSDTATLTIIYPKVSAYPVNDNFRMHFHVLNSTGYNKKTGDDSMNCSIHVYNQTDSHIVERVLNTDSNGLEWTITLNITQTGQFPYMVWCQSDSEDGFVSGDIYITDSGYLIDDPVGLVAVTLALAAVFFLWLYIGMNWEFSLMESSGARKQNALKALMVLLVLWTVPVLLQYASELAGSLFIQGDVLTLVNLVYQVSIWLNISVTIFFMIYFMYNALIYMSRSR